MALKESGEMYLESIYVLTKQNGTVRSIDICDYMGYSKPSVSRAVGLLKNGGYITVAPDGYITLTELGKNVALNLYERHTLLTNFLVELGVDTQTASDDACRIEHVISETSFNAIRNRFKK